MVSKSASDEFSRRFVQTTLTSQLPRLRHRESHQSSLVAASRVDWREILFEIDELYECTGQGRAVVKHRTGKLVGPWLAVRID